MTDIASLFHSILECRKHIFDEHDIESISIFLRVVFELKIMIGTGPGKSGKVIAGTHSVEDRVRRLLFRGLEATLGVLVGSQRINSELSDLSVAQDRWGGGVGIPDKLCDFEVLLVELSLREILSRGP